ncbi:MAG: CHASE2 domain-containing protein [Quisquiliibacterium sp.]
MRATKLERSQTDGLLADHHQAMIRALLLALGLIIAGLIQWANADLPVARQIEAHVRDLVFKTQASDTRDPRLAIIDINEESLQRIGPWPWSRETLADLAEAALAAGARIVAFDLVLAEASSDALGQVGDERLAALAALRWLVPAQAFDYVSRATRLEVGSTGGGVAMRQEAVANATGHIGNFPTLARSRCVGNIGFTPDTDGKVRKIALWTRWQSQDYPAFALAILGCLESERANPSSWSSSIQVDDDGRWAVPFTRRPSSYFAIGAASVLSGQLPQMLAGIDGIARADKPLHDKIVVVGSSALGLGDRVATPLASSVSGVTVHAAALSALLDARDGTSRPVPPGWLIWLWIPGSVLALWLTVSGGERLRRILATLAGILAIWLALAVWGSWTGSPAAVTAALWGYGLVLILQLPLEWSWAQARLRARTRLLSRYVAKPVLEQLLTSEGVDPLVPRHAQITVLIADMQDYTRHTANSQLAEAAELTRGFLEQLTHPVLENLGTLDRYTGDGLVAFWGAPIAIVDHADRAVDAAMRIVANVDRYNLQRKSQGLAELRVRIGIASGSALVGDLGTPFRIAYTAVGDCINLASRLQQLSRELDVSIAVAESCASQCQRWTFRALGLVPVRGLADQKVFTPTVSSGAPADPR